MGNDLSRRNWRHESSLAGQTPAFLEDGSFTRVGDPEIEGERPVDRRHEPKHCRRRFRRGFQEDLFHRLNVIQFRPRRCGNAARISYSAQFFLRRCFSARLGRSITGFPVRAVGVCWPIPGPAMSANFAM